MFHWAISYSVLIAESESKLHALVDDLTLLTTGGDSDGLGIL